MSDADSRSFECSYCCYLAYTFGHWMGDVQWLCDDLVLPLQAFAMEVGKKVLNSTML
jgi:hypothetical protein